MLNFMLQIDLSNCYKNFTLAFLTNYLTVLILYQVICHLFLYLKLTPQLFETKDVLHLGLNELFKTPAAYFFDTGIRNLMPRYKND